MTATATLTTATVATPPGPFTLIVAGDAVVASGWSPDAAALLEAIGAARLPAVAAALDAGTLDRRDDLGAATQAVRDYVAGDLEAIDRIPVAQSSGPFTNRAWDGLRAIPAGESRTYSQLAAEAGSPAAVRAAGSACAHNRAALFVPCHRALRIDGTLGGFLYGLDVKRWLLAHEGAAAPA